MYGDIDFGSDGYYRQEMEREERSLQEKKEYEEQCDKSVRNDFIF
jgi:hypothetical protein